MIRQIKCIYLLFALVFPSLHLSAQDTVLLRDKQYIDSMGKVLSNDYARQLDLYRQLSEQESATNRSAIDSLQKLISEMDSEIRDLTHRSYTIKSEVEDLQLALEQHMVLFETEKQKFTRLLLVTGPSLLALVLLSTILFFLLLRRQQESADRKINALKKYTYTEIEETRTDMIKQFRKRIKKLRNGLKKKNEKKTEKKERAKKNQPKKIKAKKSEK